MAQYLASITLANGQVLGVVFQPIGNADVLAALGFTPLPSTTVLVSSWNGRSGAVTLTSGDVTAALGFTPLSGNQTITLSGDASGSGATAITVAISANAVTTAKINDAAVTLAKIANAAANSKLLGSGASGSGASYSEITLGTGLTMTATTLSAPGGMAIGGAVAGASTGDVLFVAAGPVLARSPDLAWDDTNKKLTLTGAGGFLVLDAKNNVLSIASGNFIIDQHGGVSGMPAPFWVRTDGSGLVLDDSAAGSVMICSAPTHSLGFFGLTPTAQQGSALLGFSGYTANASANAVFAESTFTGNTGSTAYTISDIVAALKNYGLLAA